MTKPHHKEKEHQKEFREESGTKGGAKPNSTRREPEIWSSQKPQGNWEWTHKGENPTFWREPEVPKNRQQNTKNRKQRERETAARGRKWRNEGKKKPEKDETKKKLVPNPVTEPRGNEGNLKKRSNRRGP